MNWLIWLKTHLSRGWLVLVLLFMSAYAQQGGLVPFFDFNLRPAEGQQEVALSLQILLLLSILTIAPSIIIMTTSFIRVSIILKFVQRSLSLQQEPPNQVIMGLALFITIFIMAPTAERIYEDAYVPYSNQEISTGEFFEGAVNPLREFMFSQTRERDIGLFLEFSGADRPNTREDVPTIVLIPAFMISELTTAFQIGVLIFIPFIVIDMIVASVLMSMGMIMVPPVMISLPFKIILFVLVDGWNLITNQIVASFVGGGI